ncbi:MAG: glycoside hydrolase/phage tail family protein [Hyphomicrobiaceae bacterium]
MATLALSVAGAAAGSALLPAGVSVLGATISGAVIGSQIGALAGSYVDQALFGTSGQTRALAGPRLSDLKLTTSTEGAHIPRLFGRARLGGQIIWATPVEEEVITTRAGGGGKGSPGGSRAQATSTTNYSYYANFAVALCEGPITGIGRVWADGQELDLTTITFRLHTGAEDQAPDSLIVARLGAAETPAYRGLAYIVFERLALARFGNRLPQLSFEVHRALDPFEAQVRGVVLIPGSGEFVYATEPVVRDTGMVSTEPENTHTRQGTTDWHVALDQLDATLPNARSTSLIVSWFGSDLRAAQCQIRPAVDTADKETSPLTWSVAGLVRATAPTVSLDNDRPAYGGTPSDQTVVSAIRDLKARGHQVTLTPFILMDIPSGNALPDPYSNATTQARYPWRGRITLSIAPGRPGTPDKTAAATTQINSFVGTATPAHFTLSGDTVVYSGPAEWSLRRMVLHYAKLAQAAGGVDAFIIGSELRGLTQVRSSASTYPFVSALAALAADVKAILGPTTKITYAADWSEYFGHQPGDGTGDVYFHLDPLWASPAIDAIAIDCYWPLADWRDGDTHLDRLAGARSIYDLAYLKANITSGEGYDWYYASAAHRDAQIRTPITDGAGKPWVFRFKDLKSWWLNQHFNRPAGTQSATPTAWVPQSKPVWLTELGCPAVDKGANQPNVFVDPKSAESFLPYYSRGQRDDLMQRVYLQAFLEAFDPAHPGYVAGANPTSSLYGAPMLALDHVHIYAWDARPYPAFPTDTITWGDGDNWRLGHWINGRIAGQPLATVVKGLLEGYGFTLHDTTALDGIVNGYVVDRAMSARDALQPLELAYFFDARESTGRIRFRHRGDTTAVATLTSDDLVEDKPNANLLQLTRAQETELPAAARITYASTDSDYRQAVAHSRRLVGGSSRVSDAELALVMGAEQATATADTWLHEAWAARERASFTLPPSRLALEPGDLVALSHAGRTQLLRLTEIGDHGARDITARSIDPGIYRGASGTPRPDAATTDVLSGTALAFFLDLPLLTGTEDPAAGYVAAAKLPWPGGIAFYRSPEASGYTLAAIATQPATVGVTLDPLATGPESRLDKAAKLRVRIDQGMLISTTPLAMFAGANAAAIEAPDGSWEIIQFEVANLVAGSTYELSRLLRGQAGTETSMAATIPTGARFVMLDQAVTPVPLSSDDIGLPLNWRYGPSARDIGDATFASEAHTFRGVGYRPLSPVHINGTRNTTGDLTLSWIRRTRLGGDNWSTLEVPLAEDSERYEIDILDGSTLKRTLAATTPTATYSAAAQIADFGAPQSTLTVRITQLSATHGRGTSRHAVV